MRRLVSAALAATLLVASGFAGANAASTTTGRWSITMRPDDASRVQLRLEYTESDDGNSYSNSSWSSSVPLADAGLSADRLRGAIAPVTFQIQREPGTFSCTGSAGDGSGAGQFTYAPNAAFDNALATRGFGRPSYHQSLELAIAGTTLAFADQIRASAPHATVVDLVRVLQRGVNPRYVADLAALGYRVTAVDQLVRLRDHGVSSDFIRSVQAAGYKKLGADDLVRLADHGVRERYISELAGAGYKNLSTEELIALHDHGVSVAFVERLKSHGYPNLPVRDLIRLRDAGI